MIADYTRPQLIIKQQLQKLPNTGSRVIGPFTLGPQFFLGRYNRLAERAKMSGVLFEEVTSTNETAWQTVPAETKLSNHIVDLPYTKLFAENIEGQLFVIQKPSLTLSAAVSTKPIRTKLLSLSQPNKLRLSNQGVVVNLTTVSGSVTVATLVAGGLGFLPSKTSGSNYTIPVVGVNPAGAALTFTTAAQLKVTTNSKGQVTTIVSVFSGGAGYTNGAAVTVELEPEYAAANIRDIGDAQIPMHSELRGRPVQAGDVVYVKHTDPNTTVIKEFRRTVLRVERDEAVASAGTDADKDNQLFSEVGTRNPNDETAPAFVQEVAPTNWSIALNTNSRAGDWNGMLQGASHNGAYGERYTITVVKTGTASADGSVLTDGSGARLRIRSVSGGFSDDDIGAIAGELALVTDAGASVFRITHAALGGLIVNIVPVGSTLVAGQLFGFTITGQYDSPIRDHTGSERLVLNTSTSFAGPRDTRYVVTVTKGSTYVFKRALFILAVTSGAITGATIKAGGLGYAASKVSGDNYFVTVIGAAGVNGVLKVETDASGTITAVVGSPQTAGTGYVNAEVAYGTMPTATRPTTPYAGAEIQVTDTAGIDRPQTYVVSHGSFMDLGTYGLQFKFGTLSGTGDNPADFNTGLRKGDTFYIDTVAAAATGALGILVLSGQVADATLWDSADAGSTLFELDFRVLFSGEIPKKGNADPQFTWTATADGVKVRRELPLQVTSRDEGFNWVPVKASAFGRLFTHWRGLVPALTGETIKFLRNEVDIKARLGVEDIDNPACMSALYAYRGSQGKGVYVARLKTNDLAGYKAVLSQAERVDGIYSVAPATDDLDVQKAVRDHVNKCSQEDWKLWRRAYFGTGSPGAYAFLSTDANNSPLLATITANGSGNVVVNATGANFATNGIRAGDLYRTNYSLNSWGDTSWVEFLVQEVNSNDELLLVAGPSSPIGPAIKFEIWRPDTGTSQVEFVGNRAESFANRRVCVIWNDAPLQVADTGRIVQVPVYYLAAEIAGLRSALVQQQGLTYTELEHSIDRSPSMFTKFTQEDLNLAASKGVMIVTQETEDGPIFIRHQLTTKTTEGSLYYEDSVGFNFDMIAYDFKDVLQPFVGKQNATPETVDAIETKIRTSLDANKAARGETIIGPALLGYSYQGKSGKFLVEIDPVFKDRINLGVDLELPLPINSIIVNLNATTLQSQVVATA